MTRACWRTMACVFVVGLTGRVVWAADAPPPGKPPPPTPLPWTLSLGVIDGLTQLEMRHGEELLMRVQCEKLDLRTPAGGLQATGRVAVTGPCVEARCERLTVAWATGQVALDGAV